MTDSILYGIPTPKASSRLDEIVLYPIYFKLDRTKGRYGHTINTNKDRLLYVEFKMYAKSVESKWLGVGLYNYSKVKLPQHEEVVLQYILYPTNRGGDASTATLYSARNTMTERLEYAVGPDHVLEFAANAPMYFAAALNFLGFVDNTPDYQLSSSMAGYLFMQGKYREGWEAIGNAWLEALQNPEGYFSLL